MFGSYEVKLKNGESIKIPVWSKKLDHERIKELVLERLCNDMGKLLEEIIEAHKKLAGLNAQYAYWLEVSQAAREQRP